MVQIDWSSPTPQTAEQLTYAERLLIHALRMWVRDRSRWSEVILEFNRICGPRLASHVCRGLDRAFALLGTAARRRIRLRAPVCRHVSPDEISIVNLIAAIQHGDDPHVEAAVRWLIPTVGAPDLVAALGDVADGLYAAGYEIPVRRPAAGTQGEATAPVRIVH